ncbi:glycoside hydrolase family 108 protein [Sphingomonas sp. ID0503]|uniref:glycoside hydrolase family 108 protein n=1 Tax=Sphingomonas sp. ID0503 TaxID=3399691 RepID=UPI003AFAD9BE
MTIEQLIDDVIDREGGYVDHPDDLGGPTRYGITHRTARAHGYAGSMKTFPRAQAVAIYRRMFWSQPGFDRIAPLAPHVAAELFDTGVNMGPAVATAFLRRALNALNRNGRDYPDLPTIGLMDDTLLAALTAFLKLRGSAGERVLLKALEALQGERYLHLAESRPANEAFLYGWLANRIGSL